MTVTMTLVGVTSHNLLLPKFQKEKKKKKAFKSILMNSNNC